MTDDDPGVYTTGAPLPPHLRCDLPPLRPTPGDPLSLRIARLLQFHPELDAEFPGVDLVTMGREARRALLRRVRDRLGIPERLDAGLLGEGKS
jgi:hypothetical protein